jgi:ribosomal protein S18 acetylase RimI-like enzyme
MAVSVRRAVSSELPLLAKALAPLPLFTRYRLSEEALRARWEAALAADEPLLIAAEGEELLGLCSFLPQGAFAMGAYLRTLAVVPGAQGRGVGARLLEGFEQACQASRGGCFLLVSDFNAGAQRFYARHGYNEVGRLSGLVVPDVTELVYWKRQGT